MPLVRASTGITTSVTPFAAELHGESPSGNVSFGELGRTTTCRSSSHVLRRFRRSGQERPVNVNVNGLGDDDAVVDRLPTSAAMRGQLGVDLGVVEARRQQRVELGVPRLGLAGSSEHRAGAGATPRQVDALRPGR